MTVSLSTATAPATHVGVPGLLVPPAARSAAYQVRLARTEADLRAAQALRFEVFNLELDEGLVQSYDSGLDADPYDAVCEHLIVEDGASGAVVGTYRLQTGLQARHGLGYYSEREFDFTPFEERRGEILELGRACIHQQHRNFKVLNGLWKGIFAHARERGSRYLLGCSSFTTQDPVQGLAAAEALRPHRAGADWWTEPHPRFACVAPAGAPAPTEPPRIPRLLSGYLALGAQICSPPAIDREFRTIDFLTVLDARSPTIVALQQRGRFSA